MGSWSVLPAVAKPVAVVLYGFAVPSQEVNNAAAFTASLTCWALASASQLSDYRIVGMTITVLSSGPETDPPNQPQRLRPSHQIRCRRMCTSQSGPTMKNAPSIAA